MGTYVMHRLRRPIGIPRRCAHRFEGHLASEITYPELHNEGSTSECGKFGGMGAEPLGQSLWRSQRDCETQRRAPIENQSLA